MRTSLKKAVIATAVVTVALSAQAFGQGTSIRGGEANADPDTTVGVDFSLTTDADVAGTENVIAFTAPLSVAAKANGKPNCAVNPDIDKSATAFAFQPSGCTGAACVAVKALVLSLDNVDVIPTGSVLYTCQIAVAADAPGGDFELNVESPGASSPTGTSIPTTGVAGSVTVSGGPGAAATIVVGNGTGNAGETILVSTSLETGSEVAGTENVISFVAPLSIAAKANGKPDCTVNEDIDKGATAFAFQPSGCTGAACTAVKALVLSLDNVAPIPNDSVMYTCKVNIAEGAADGEYPLTCSAPGASDPAGVSLDAACQNGKVTVGEVVDGTPTSTPTETPTGEVMTPTATATATIEQPTATVTRTPTIVVAPTNTPKGGRGADDDGCAVVAPAQSSTGWMLLLPAAALLWFRRRNK
ncbi:MAG: hypothetical protein ABI629_07410 [bacterium]